MSRISVLVAATALIFFAAAAASDATEDVQLRAMRDELGRARTLALNDLDKPYFVQYTSSDNTQFAASATLGGLISVNSLHVRQPKLQVRVGSYQLDNTNASFSREVQLGLLPLDDDYQVMRDRFWLWTDLLYKGAIDQINRKRTALNELASPDSTADFAPAKPVQIVRAPAAAHLDEDAWRDEVRRLSRLFARYGNVMNSRVRMRSISSTYRLVNTEGTAVRIPQELTDVEIVASTFAADGSRIWNHRFVTVMRPDQLPPEDRLGAMVDSAAAETEALAKAPIADDYSGPVLFEGEAAAQAMAQVLSNTIRLQRKPLVPAGGSLPPGQFMESLWASRIGSRVLPEWLTLVDDPRQNSFAGVKLAGEYEVDDEGVPAQRVLVVDKGVLKGFLLSRMPVRTYNGSNGHGRLSGGFGSAMATFGNLFVQAENVVSEQQLKTRLIRETKRAGLKFGILIRRLDFPSTANLEEWQSILSDMQRNGFVRTLNEPILTYRVYPDGREELVRGLRFREFSAKDLRDISAASDRSYVLNYVNNGSPQNLTDVGSEATTSSVVCPSLLFESVELGRAEGDGGKLPLVPSPALSTVAAR